MKAKDSRIWVIFMAAAALSGCGGFAGGEVEVPVVVPVQQIPADPVGGLIPLSNFNIPLTAGQNTAPQGVSSLILTDLELRTVTSDAQDQTDQALLDPSLMGRCRSGQADLGFIDSLTISIKKKGADNSTAVWLAKYTKPSGLQEAPCSISFQTNPDLDLIDYLGGYELQAQVSISGSNSAISIGGFARVAADGQFPAPSASAAPSGSGNPNPAPSSGGGSGLPL